jgi:hypothetical protein
LFGAFLLWTLFGLAYLGAISSWMDWKSDQEDSRRRARGIAEEGNENREDAR